MPEHLWMPVWQALETSARTNQSTFDSGTLDFCLYELNYQLVMNDILHMCIWFMFHFSFDLPMQYTTVQLYDICITIVSIRLH